MWTVDQCILILTLKKNNLSSTFFPFILHTDHYPPLLPSSPCSVLSVPSLSPSFFFFLSPFIPPPSAFRKGQASHGFEQSMAHQVDAGSSSSLCIRARQGNPASLLSLKLQPSSLGMVVLQLSGQLTEISSRLIDFWSPLGTFGLWIQIIQSREWTL